MSNLYYNPEEFGLEILYTLEDPNASWDFSTIVLWKHIDSGKLFWAHSSGCSCPSPFEEYHFNGPDRTDLHLVSSSKKELKELLDNGYTKYDSNKIQELLDIIKKLSKKVKVVKPIVKTRERIDELRFESSDFTYIQKPLDEFLSFFSKGIVEKIDKVKTTHGNTFEDIQVEFSPSIEEYTYPDDTDVPGLIFTGIRKD